MIRSFSRYLQAIEKSLPSKHQRLVRGDLYLTVVDWYITGVEPNEAALRIKNALDG